MTAGSMAGESAAAPPRITVVLSSYNHAKYLRDSIESVLNQTYREFELIIWDDASTDDSWRIISEYGDNRIRAFRNSVNLRDSYRLAMRTYRGLGEYVAIHHSDDVWEPEKLERQVQFLDTHPDVGAVFTRVRVIDENGADLTDQTNAYWKIFEQVNRSRQEWLRRFFFNGNCLCHPSVLFRRPVYDACGGYRNGLAQLADLDLWIRMCLIADIHVLQDRLTRFRVRDNEANMSGNRPDSRLRLRFETLKVAESFLAFQSASDFNETFHEEWKEGVQSIGEIPFVLAQIALQHVPFDGAKLFALNILFSELNSPAQALLLRERFHFSHAQFMKLTGSTETGLGPGWASGTGIPGLIRFA